MPEINRIRFESVKRPVTNIWEERLCIIYAAKPDRVEFQMNYKKDNE